MKTPLPEPAWDCPTGFRYYTESQLKATMVAAYNEAIESSAKACDSAAHAVMNQNHIAIQERKFCAEMIRKLKEQTP